ncbi:MAG: hypothetical protein ACRCZF_22480 [Gemmataceae bacterium]
MTPTTLLLTIGLGQLPYGLPVNPAPPGGMMPNIYNRMQQPLSPYLNLLRGGNPGVNYFYGVRPGIMPNFAPPTYQQGQPGMFLPQAGTVVDGVGGAAFEPGGKPVVLRSPGNPVLYGNYFNGHGSYFSVFAQNVNRQGGAAAGRGPNGMNGLGSVPARPNTRR